jgi:hypothetical protein
MTRLAGMSNPPIQGDAIVKEFIYENANYAVHVVRLPDMFFDTYAIINKKYGVIEQIHPNLFNVTKIADQFNDWIVNGGDGDDEGYVGDMFGSLPGGGLTN